MSKPVLTYQAQLAAKNDVGDHVEVNEGHRGPWRRMSAPLKISPTSALKTATATSAAVCFRVNNAIKYAGPKINGLTFGALYSFTNTNAADRGTTELWSLAVNYAFGGFNIAGVYLYAKVLSCSAMAISLSR
jgi:predicted porin